MSFEFLEPMDRENFEKVQFVIYLIDIIINLNTSFIENGVLIEERMKVFSNYIQRFFIWDFLTIISLAGKNNYFPHEMNDHKNVLIFLQLLFFTKIKLFQVRYNHIKEIFCLDTKLKGFIFCKLFVYFFFLIKIINKNIFYNRNFKSFNSIDEYLAFCPFFCLYVSFHRTKFK